MKNHRTWRSWAEMPGEDLVMMPRSLALDLVRLINYQSFFYEATEEEVEEEVPEKKFEAHRERMDKILNNLVAHMCDEDLTPTADLMLRTLVMAYEAAPDIPAEKKPEAIRLDMPAAVN